MQPDFDWDTWVKEQRQAVENAWGEVQRPDAMRVKAELEKSMGADQALVSAIAGKRFSEIDWYHPVLMVEGEWLAHLEPASKAYYTGALLLDTLEHWVVHREPYESAVGHLSLEYHALYFLSSLKTDAAQWELITNLNDPQKKILAEVMSKLREVYPNAGFPGKKRDMLERLVARLEGRAESTD